MKTLIFGHFTDGDPFMETAHDRQRFFDLLAHLEKNGEWCKIDAINVDGKVPAYVRDWLAEHRDVRLEG